jgi:predicted ester cyclase
VAILDSVVTEDVIGHPLNPGQPPGREALKQIFGGFSVLVPDLRITVEDIIAGGDRAAVRSTVTGTPAGPYLGVSPAGRPMRFEAIDIWRTADGLVAGGWHVEDFVAALVDWGAVTFASRPRGLAPPPAAETTPDRPGHPLDVVGRWYQALRSADVEVIGTVTISGPCPGGRLRAFRSGRPAERAPRAPGSHASCDDGSPAAV